MNVTRAVSCSREKQSNGIFFFFLGGDLFTVIVQKKGRITSAEQNFKQSSFTLGKYSLLYPFNNINRESSLGLRLNSILSEDLPQKKCLKLVTVKYSV